MTDCILEAINSSIQAYISALTGRLCPSISRPLVGLRKMIHGFALLGGSALIGGANGLHLEQPSTIQSSRYVGTDQEILKRYFGTAPQISKLRDERVEHQQPARKLMLHSNHQHLVSPESANGCTERPTHERVEAARAFGVGSGLTRNGLIQRVHESTRLGMMSRSDEPALDAVGGQQPSAPCVGCGGSGELSQQLGHIPSSLRLFEHRRLRRKAHLKSLPSRGRFCYCHLSVGLAQWRAQSSTALCVQRP